MKRRTMLKIMGLEVASVAMTTGNMILHGMDEAEAAVVGQLGVFDYVIEGNDAAMSLSVALDRYTTGKFDMAVALANTLKGVYSQVKAKNPSFVWAVYLNGTHSQQLDHPADWYLYDKYGNMVVPKDFPKNRLMDPRSGWKDYNVQHGLSLLNGTGANALYIDELGIGPIRVDGLSGAPINPATGLAWTNAEWMPQMDNILMAFNAATPRYIYCNGLGNGVRYFDPAAPTSTLLSYCDYSLAESFMRGAKNPATYYPSLSTWTKEVQMVEDAGANLMACSKIWVTIDSTTRSRIHRYCLGTFMLGFQPGAMWYFTGQRATTVTPWNALWDKVRSLGAPTAPRGGYYRTFQNGSVTVDPVAHDAVFTLLVP